MHGWQFSWYLVVYVEVDEIEFTYKMGMDRVLHLDPKNQLH